MNANAASYITSYFFIGKKSSIVQESVVTDDRSSESIEATFSSFVDDMNDVLDKEDFARIQRKCLENVNVKGALQLSKDNEQEIRGTKNVAELFTVMCCHYRPYWNWMNIRALEKMAGNCVQAKQLIEKYKKDVCSRKVKDVIPEILNLEIPTDYTEVKEKYDKDFNDLLIEDIVKRWSEIEKKLDVEETMLVKSFTEGCVEICWLLPNYLVDHAIHSATNSYQVSQSTTQEQVKDDYHSEPAKDDGQSATQKLFAEVLYLKIGEVIIKDDTTGLKDDATGKHYVLFVYKVSKMIFSV